MSHRGLGWASGLLPLTSLERYVISARMTVSTKRKSRVSKESQTAKGRARITRGDKGQEAAARPASFKSELTYVEDRGAVYNAPLEVVWDFMEKDETFHPKAHTSDVRNFNAKELSDNTILLSYQEKRDGRWQKRVCRMTTIRPAVRVQEDLVGPYAGSMTIFLYTPRGKQTLVDVFSYSRSSELTPAQIKRHRKKVWSKAYAEDLPYFRRFARQHPSVKRGRG